MTLTSQEIREFVVDTIGGNYLLDGEELSDTQINIAMALTVDDWNNTAPTSADTISQFPYKNVLMMGTLYRCFMGQAALRARNTFAFSDGGISIPLEERFALYQTLAAMYQAEYQSSMTKIKIRINMDEGWGNIGSDYARFPLW